MNKDGKDGRFLNTITLFPFLFYFLLTVIAYLLSNNVLIFKFIAFYNLCWHEN